MPESQESQKEEELGEFRLRNFATQMPLNPSLGRVSQYLSIINLYKEYMWIYFPLHPAIFDEENVRYVLTTIRQRRDKCIVYRH